METAEPQQFEEQIQEKQSNLVKVQSADKKITLDPVTNSPKDVKQQIVMLILASGILAIFSFQISSANFQREEMLRLDFQVAAIETQTDNFQSWYLFSNGMSCAFLMTVNVVLLLIMYLSLTYSMASINTGYFQKWYKIIRFVILLCYFFFLAGLYLIYGTAVSAVQIIYPYYCDNDVEAHVQEEGIREDVNQCNTGEFGNEGLFKTLAVKIQTAVYVVVILFSIFLFAFSLIFNIWWEKFNSGDHSVPSKGLKMWLNSLNLDANYEYCFAGAGVTLKTLKAVSGSEQVLYTVLSKIGVSSQGDILKIIGSVQNLKNTPDTDSQIGVDLEPRLNGQDQQKMENSIKQNKHRLQVEVIQNESQFQERSQVTTNEISGRDKLLNKIDAGMDKKQDKINQLSSLVANNKKK